jgi:hypothetical protein
LPIAAVAATSQSWRASLLRISVLQVRYDVEIGRTPDEVFDFLADFSNDAKWRANVVEMVPLGSPQDAGGVWSRQIERRQVPGRIIETEAVITSFEPPRRLAVRRASGPVRPEAVYELSALDGRSRIDFRVEVELAGASLLLAPLVLLLLNAIVKPTLPGDFARLKQRLERRL